jgi:hypothetical protein
MAGSGYDQDPAVTGDALANLIEAVATIIALAGLAVSFWFSWSGQRLQREQADAAARAAVESNREAQAAAHRAAVSASLTIDQLTRIADAVSTLGVQPGASSPRAGAGAFGGVEPSAAPAAVAWRLESTGGDAYRLTNVGRAPAHDVSIGGAASLDGPYALGGAAEKAVADAVGARALAPGASLGFAARILPGTADSTITVTWAAPEPASWRYPLPAPAAPTVN